MPTKQQTTSSQQQESSSSSTQSGSWQNNYNPAAMATYNAFMPQFQSGMAEFAGSPLQSMFFNNLLGQGYKQIGLQGQSNMQTFLNNIRNAGVSGDSPFAQSQVAALGRSQSAQNSSLFGNLLNQANQLRFGALQGMGSFNPLVTGGSQTSLQSGTQKGTQTGQQTQTTSGLGTWLPQVIGGGVGMLSSLGGASLLSKGGGSMGFGKAMQGPSGGFNNYSGLNLQNPFMYAQGGAGGIGAAGFQTPNLMGTPGPALPTSNPMLMGGM